MRQTHPLRNVSRTRSPDQSILEALLERPVDSVTYVLNGAVVANDQCLAEVWLDTLALGVNSHQSQLIPAPIYHVLNAKIKLAAHDYSIRFSGELIEKVEANAVDLVVDVYALDIRPVILHDDVDELVDSGYEVLESGRISGLVSLPFSSRTSTSQLRMR